MGGYTVYSRKVTILKGKLMFYVHKSYVPWLSQIWTMVPLSTIYISEIGDPAIRGGYLGKGRICTIRAVDGNGTERY